MYERILNPKSRFNHSPLLYSWYGNSERTKTKKTYSYCAEGLETHSAFL